MRVEGLSADRTSHFSVIMEVTFLPPFMVLFKNLHLQCFLWYFWNMIHEKYHKNSKKDHTSCMSLISWPPQDLTPFLEQNFQVTWDVKFFVILLKLELWNYNKNLQKCHISCTQFLDLLWISPPVSWTDLSSCTNVYYGWHSESSWRCWGISQGICLSIFTLNFLFVAKYRTLCCSSTATSVTILMTLSGSRPMKCPNQRLPRTKVGRDDLCLCTILILVDVNAMDCWCNKSASFLQLILLSQYCSIFLEGSSVNCNTLPQVK